MGVEVIAALAAIVIASIAIVWLVKVVKTTIFAALGIVVILVLLSMFMGLTPQAIWEAALDLFETSAGWLPNSSGQ